MSSELIANKNDVSIFISSLSYIDDIDQVEDINQENLDRLEQEIDTSIWKERERITSLYSIFNRLIDMEKLNECKEEINASFEYLDELISKKQTYNQISGLLRDGWKFEISY